MIEQTTKYAAEDGFFAKLAAGAKTADGPLPAELQEKLDAGAAAARRGLRRTGRASCEAELLPAAPEKDAVGRERYALASRVFLGAAVDLEETYAWGVRSSSGSLPRRNRWPGKSGPAPPSRRPRRS